MAPKKTQKAAPSRKPAAKRLTRQDILSANDIKFEDVIVPEWQNGMITIRGLDGHRRDKMTNEMLKNKEMSADGKDVDITAMQTRMLVACIVDENNKQLFDENDIMKFQQKNAGVISRLFVIAQRLSGTDVETTKELGKALA